jgi:hypothetical protein
MNSEIESIFKFRELLENDEHYQGRTGALAEMKAVSG